MSNAFDEDQWVKGQIVLDQRICLEFEAVEAGYVAAEAFGTLDDWRLTVASQVSALRAQVARITHAARRAHWEAELTRLGFRRTRKDKAEAAAVEGLAAHDAADTEPSPMNG